DAAYDLGIVLLELGEASTALPHLRRARTLNPRRPDVAFNIVRAELEAGQVSEARAEAQASAKDLGSAFQWIAAIAQLFFMNAKPQEAVLSFPKAKRVHPDYSVIRPHLVAAS